MTYSEHLALLFLFVLLPNCVYGATVKRDNEENGKSTAAESSPFSRSLLGGEEERNLEQEIQQELNHLSARKQREIFDDLERQNEKFNVSQKSLLLSETENLSPLNVEELRSIRKTIKTSNNSSLPAIRNKRTLNFLLMAVARAMGYTLTPTNPDAEWIPRQQPPPAQPCMPTPPPCRPNPPSTPPPCAMPPTAPPCGSAAQMQPATIPPNQINANTISYPFRPARTIPLLNFAPLPQGVRVPYPPLLQPPAQRSPCATPPPPCGSTPPPSPPPCGAPPSSPPPCRPTPAPCGATTPPPAPCGSTPAPRLPPCGATPAPRPSPCGTPSPPPCSTTPAPPPPCPGTPAPRPPPCATTPAPPPPCATTPAPPPPCGNPPPPPPPSQTPKKGSILLEYDDPVRIQIFSNDKKYLPASGNLYSGHDGGHEDDLHSYFFPGNEKIKKKNEDVEEEEEEEHIEAEEEEDDAPGRQEDDDDKLKYYEEEDERALANNEEDESETNLSVVKKPVDHDVQKSHQRSLVSSKAKTSSGEKTEKTQKMKKPKRKKWVRIVKKQRRKTKTDSTPHDNFQVYTSDSIPEGSRFSPKVFGKPQDAFFSHERDFDFDSSGSQSHEDPTNLELKKVTVDSPDLIRDVRRFELNINPYAPEPEAERRKKLEKAVERYVEDYIEKQLGDELIKNTGLPKTTVFEFAPKNGPKIQTVTTTVAKTSHTGSAATFNPKIRPETDSRPTHRPGARLVKNTYESLENAKRRGTVSYEAFATRS